MVYFISTRSSLALRLLISVSNIAEMGLEPDATFLIGVYESREAHSHKRLLEVLHDRGRGWACDFILNEFNLGLG